MGCDQRKRQFKYYHCVAEAARSYGGYSFTGFRVWVQGLEIRL